MQNFEESHGQSSIEKAVVAQINDLVPGSEPIVVAFSGGIDSRVLLEILARTSGRSLRVLHVNHNIRPKEELEKELELVRNTCKKLGVSLTIATVPHDSISRFAQRKKCGIEAAARYFRYRALHATCLKFSIRYAATAHTADDQFETQLYRLLKGANPESLRGIPKKRKISDTVFVVRPMLDIRRKDIETYRRERQLEFSEDSTNSGYAYVRNRIRHYAIPALEDAMLDWRSGFRRSMEQIHAFAQLQQAEARKVLEKVSKDRVNRTLTIPFDIFMSQSEIIQKNVLRRCCAWVSAGTHASDRACTSAIVSLKSGTEHLVCCGVLISRQQEKIIFSSEHAQQRVDGYFFVFHKPEIIRRGRVVIGLQWKEGKPLASETQSEHGSLGETRNTAWAATAGAEKFDFEQPSDIFLYEGSFNFPLIIRSRKAGDTIKTENGHAAIDDILKNWHIQNSMRDIVPIVEDRDGIVAILPALLNTAECDYKRFRPFPITGNPGKLQVILKGVSYFHV